MGKKPTTQTEPKLTPQILVTGGACPVCQSLKRSDYFGVTTQAYAGETVTGQRYTHIVRRRTICEDCGQTRIELSYEDRGETCSPDEPPDIS